MKKESIVIVGAGVAGLTLAYKLLKDGVRYPVVVVEKEDRVGGLARSFVYKTSLGAFTFDIGPHRFHTDDPVVKDFLLEILADDYIEIDRSSAVWMYDQYHDWPLKITTAFKLPPWVMFKSVVDILFRRKPETESFEDFIIGKYGRTLYTLFFKPYTEKFLKYNCSQLHSDWAKSGINRAVIDKRIKADSLIDLIQSVLIPKPVHTKFIYPGTGGNDLFCRYLEKRVRDLGGSIFLSSALTAARAKAGILDTVVLNNSEEICPRFLFWSAPIPPLLKLLDVNSGLPSLEYLSIVLANYIIDAPPAQPYQWCYFGTDTAPVSRISIPTVFNPSLSPENKSGLCVELSCFEGDGLWNRPERMDVIIEEFLVKARLISRHNDVADVKFERIPNAYPVYTLNYPRKLSIIDKELRNFTNVLTFGRSGCFWYNNQDHSIRQALDIAAIYTRGQDSAKMKQFCFERDLAKL